MEDIILRMNNIHKEFSGVTALAKVDLSVRRGEIHALVGENGAGKSTLMNILSGVYPYGSYSGDIFYDGELCRFRNLKDSEAKGIVIIHQELSLISGMSIAENIFLGHEQKNRFGGIDWERTYSEAAKLMKRIGLDEDARTPVSEIGAGKRQLTEITKALSKNVRLLILDEPTSSLNEEESMRLLDLLIRFRNEGITSIIISHKLNEVAYVSDRITVIRDGETIETMDNASHTVDENLIIKSMVGRELTNRYPQRHSGKAAAAAAPEPCESGRSATTTATAQPHAPYKDETALDVKHYTVKATDSGRIITDDVSFHVSRGEVIGIAGLTGAGRTELCMSLFGSLEGTEASGEVSLFGRSCSFSSPKEAIKAGLVYVTEDRGGNGLLLDSSIVENTTIAAIEKVTHHRVVDREKEEAAARSYVGAMGTKTKSIRQNVRNLSGGNQQKVLLSKWLFAEPEVIMLDEPTRGIDVGAKYDIYTIINRLVEEGKAIIMVSSEMGELLGMCDRIYVMNEGRFVGEFTAAEASQEKIMAAIIRSQKRMKE